MVFSTILIVYITFNKQVCAFDFVGEGWIRIV